MRRLYLWLYYRYWLWMWRTGRTTFPMHNWASETIRDYYKGRY